VATLGLHGETICGAHIYQGEAVVDGRWKWKCSRMAEASLELRLEGGLWWLEPKVLGLGTIAEDR